MNQGKLRGKYHRRLKMRFLRIVVKTLKIFQVSRKLRRNAQSACRTLCRVLWRVVCWKPLKTILITGVITVGLVTIVFLLPSHYRQVGWGTLVFIVGSAVSIITEPLKKRKRLKWLRPIFIPILLATGALLTTQGWNTVNNYKQEQALVVEAATEWRLNELRNPGIEFGRDYIKDSNYEKGYLFELPTHWQITRAIDISRLERSSLKNSPLRAALVVYVQEIDLLCTRLGAANQLFAEPLGSRKTYPKMIQQTFGNGDAYPEYRKTHRLVEAILRKRYPGLLEKTDWIKIEWKVRRKVTSDKQSVDFDPNQQVDPNSHT